MSRSKSPVVWIFILFVGGPLAGFIFITSIGDWRPFGMANHGELITPARPEPVGIALKGVDGTALPEKILQGRWTLLTLTENRCGPVCDKNLYAMRQSQIAQGLEDLDRLRYLLLVTGSAETETLQKVAKQHPRLVIAAGVKAKMLRRLLAWLAVEEPLAKVPAAGRIYLIDPVGNLMMRYAPDANPRGLIQDLERLLKLSRMG